MFDFWKDSSADSEPPVQLIEGISNQVLAFVVTCFVGVLSFTAFVYKCFSREVNPDIHPDSWEHVEMTRTARNVESPRNREGAFGRLSEESCPICLVPFRQPRPEPDLALSQPPGQPSVAVETNCGHLFCSECLLRFHAVSAVINPLVCPVCRQRVTLLMWDRSLPYSSLSSEQKQQISSIQTYNRRFSGQPRSLMDIIRDMPILIRHFVRNIFSVGGIRLLFRFRSFVFITTCLLYIVLPLDLLPEALFGILGLLDDVFIILCAVTWISIQYRNQLLEPT